MGRRAGCWLCWMMRVGFRRSCSYSGAMRLPNPYFASRLARYLALCLVLIVAAAPALPVRAAVSPLLVNARATAPLAAGGGFVEWLATAIGWQRTGTSVGGTSGHVADGAVDDLTDDLAVAGRLAAQLDARPPALALAAAVSGEGHWTFMNGTGTRFTAASKPELERVSRGCRCCRS